jgi:hypothetical protein
MDRHDAQYDDADRAERDDAGPMVQPIPQAETNNTGRHDKPKHKSMKMLAISERNGRNRQHGYEHRHGETVH